MHVSAVNRLPQEIWHQIAITLRDHLRCPHGYAIAFDEYPCEFLELIGWDSVPSGPPHCFIATQSRPKSLSETCRFLHTLLQPLLYETIPMDGREPKRITSIIQTLSHRQDLISHVRNLYALHQSPQPEDTILAAAAEQLVPQLHRLRVLCIVRAIVTPTISQFIHTTQSLREVHLDSRRWSDDVPSDHSEEWSPSGGHFTNLSISTMQNASFLTPKLTTLSLLIDTVYEIIPLLDRGVYSLEGVINLKVEDWETKMMLRLFTHLPNLKKLHVADSLMQVPLIAFDGNGVLPQLQSIDAWSNIAKVFEGRNEIRDLRLNFDDSIWWYKKKTSTFHKVFPNLKKLSLGNFSCLPDTISALSVRYPELVWLEIDGEFLPSITTWLREQLHAGNLGTLPQLEVLRLTHIWGGEPEGFQVEVWCSLPLTAEMKTEVELLDAVKQRHCPKLCEARISWGRTWRHDADGWMPVVRPEF